MLQPRTLAATFRRIVSATMALSGGVALAACDGSSGQGATADASKTNGDDGASQPVVDASGDGDMSSVQPVYDASGDGDASSGDSQAMSDADGASAIVCDGYFSGNCEADGGFAETFCFNLDASSLASLDASSGAGSYCNPLCGAAPDLGQGDGGNTWEQCWLTAGAGGTQVQCTATCVGRRPEGLVDERVTGGTSLGAYLAEIARLEAASVDAFRQLRRELVAHGAPRRLVRAAERAARDEVRHARRMAGLARRYGGRVTRPRIEQCAVRSLESVALDNAIEGCVLEAFGALVATWQARAAEDPVIRAVMARIARDETRHAMLACEVHGWACARLTRDARRRIEVERRLALARLASRPLGSAPLRAALGLPTPSETRVLAEAMAREAA